MTVGEREILFATDCKDTDRLIGRVLAGNPYNNYKSRFIDK